MKLRWFSVPEPAGPEQPPTFEVQKEVEEGEITHHCVAM